MSQENEDTRTPRRGLDNRHYQMNTATPMSNISSQRSNQGSVSATPLVLGTPRTPYLGTPSQKSNNTPIRSLPRGDIGRILRVPAFNSTPTPATPNSWMGSPGGSPDGSPDRGGNNRGSPDGSPNRGGNNGDNNSENRGGIADNSELPSNNLGDTVIWGTNINAQTCSDTFREFIENFTQGREFEPFYMRQLQIIHRTGQMVLNINCQHLSDYHLTRAFLKQLQEFPQEVIPIMDQVINDFYFSQHGEQEVSFRIQVRTYGLPNVSKMRSLDPNNIDQLVSLKGMVLRCSSIIPELKQSFFRCYMCNVSIDILIDRGRIEEPSKCPSCNAIGGLELIHNRCLFTDKQLIRLQETPDEIPEGETPKTITLFAFDDLVDTVRPGDRIEVTGVFRAVAKRTNSKHRTLGSIYKTYIDSIHFRRSGLNEDSMTSLGEALNTGDDDDIITSMSDKKFSADRIQEFHNFVTQGNVYDRLVRNFAPSIWEMEDIKRGVLCLLFGGSLQSTQDRNAKINRINNNYNNNMGMDMNGNENEYGMDDDNHAGNINDEINGDNGNNNNNKVKTHLRGDINILLCGDPGTSKSQLLSYVHKITPRGIYTSGKGSSAVGLTASVGRDPETNDVVLESGALVLSDNGICCIDEFDKMSDSTRAILHEAMEQQTVSITKAGIIATLNARTSILASANPVESRYNPRLSVVDNIKLPPTLLSRFDLLYLVLDKANPDSDRRLAKHLVSLYYPDESIRANNAEIDQTFLKDFILYARTTYAPTIANDAVETLVQGYLEMRSLGGKGSKTITATTRQLESLIRISQSLAKMRLSNTATVEDVNESIRLMKVATQAAATDPRTGTIDMDMITTGRTVLDRDLVLKLAEELRSLFETKIGSRLTIGQIRQILIRNSGNPNLAIAMSEIEEAVRELEAEGIVTFIERTQTCIIRGRSND